MTWLTLALCLLPHAAFGQTAPPAHAQPAQPPAQPQAGQGSENGVLALPTGPPPTGQQAPLPRPTGAIPPGSRPLQISPTLQQIQGRVPAQPLTIQDAVAIALQNNRPMAQAVEALLQARGHTAEAKAAFNPTLGAGFTYTQLNSSQTVNFGGHSITIVNAEQPELTATAALPIDISGEIRAATQQAQFQEIASEIDVNRVRNQTVLDVKNAFYGVLRAQALLVVARGTLADARDNWSVAQKKLLAGTVARFDVIRAQTDVDNAEQGVIAAQSQVSLAIASLNSTLGIAIDSPVAVTDQGAVARPPAATETAPPAVGPSATSTTPPPSPTTGVVASSLDLGARYQGLVSEALSTRPEVLEADASVAAARKGILLARRSSLPTLAISLNGTYQPNVGAFGVSTSGAAVLSLSVPIFDGGVSAARMEQARAVVGQAETNRRQAQDLVNLQVRSAYLTLLQARDSVYVADQGVVEAREAYRLAVVRYNNGVSTLVEVSDAQAALTQAEQNQVNALYSYNNARSALDQAVGRYSYIGGGPGFPAPPSPKTLGVSGRESAARAAGK